MLFTSPIFAFLFLPLSVLIYVISSKGHRRACLLAICAFYHLLANFYSPQNLVLIPALILYCWGGGLLLARFRQRWLAFLLGGMPFLSLLILRQLAYFGVEGFTYPVGLTVMTLGAVSYLVESVRGNVPKVAARPHNLALYLGFYPILVVGPFVRYTEFLRITEEDSVNVSTETMAQGVRLFAMGFVKRVALGVVLMDTFERFITIVAGHSDILVGTLLLVLVYFGIFFTVSGYLDMGCGIALMYGIRLPYTRANPFRAALPEEYGRSLFGSLFDWCEDYVVGALLRMTRGKGEHWIRGVVLGSCVLLTVRSSLYVLALVLPFVIVSYLNSRFDILGRLRQRPGLRVLLTMVSVVLLSVCWVILTKGDLWAVLDYVGSLTYSNSEYHMDLMLVSFSDRRFLFVLAISVFTLLPHLGLGRSLSKLGAKRQAVLEAVSTVGILLIFTFTVLFFLQGASAFDAAPFRYIFI